MALLWVKVAWWHRGSIPQYLIAQQQMSTIAKDWTEEEKEREESELHQPSWDRAIASSMSVCLLPGYPAAAAAVHMLKMFPTGQQLSVKKTGV